LNGWPVGVKSLNPEMQEERQRSGRGTSECSVVLLRPREVLATKRDQKSSGLGGKSDIAPGLKGRDVPQLWVNPLSNVLSA